MLGRYEHETDTKNRTLKNSTSKLTNPLESVKNHLRLLDRSIMMPEIGVGPRWATNGREKSNINEFSFSAHEPLRNGKKTIQAFESLNSDARDRSWVEITKLGQDEHETNTKNQSSTNLASEVTNPLGMVKKTNSGF